MERKFNPFNVVSYMVALFQQVCWRISNISVGKCYLTLLHISFVMFSFCHFERRMRSIRSREIS